MLRSIASSWKTMTTKPSEPSSNKFKNKKQVKTVTKRSSHCSFIPEDISKGPQLYTRVETFSPIASWRLQHTKYILIRRYCVTQKSFCTLAPFYLYTTGVVNVKSINAPLINEKRTRFCSKFQDRSKTLQIAVMNDQMSTQV
jgi:hypothetical protein